MRGGCGHCKTATEVLLLLIGVTAVLVVGETAGPGMVGVAFLDDSAKPRLAWLAIIGFIGGRR